MSNHQTISPSSCSRNKRAKLINNEEEEGMREEEFLRNEQVRLLKKIINRIENKLAADEFLKITSQNQCFVGDYVPEMSLLSYAERIVKITNIWTKDVDSPFSAGIRSCLIVLYLMENSTTLKKSITPKSIHRVFLILFLLALKFTEDISISANFWGQVGGCSQQEINFMEIKACELLEWKVGISVEKYGQMSQWLYNENKEE